MEPYYNEPLGRTSAGELPSMTMENQGLNARSARLRLTGARARPDMKLAALLETWKQKRRPSLKTLAAAQKAVRDFASYIGDVGIGEITAEDCFEFRDAAEQMPRSMPHRHRSLSFLDAHAIYANRCDVDRLSPSSVKKYLGAVQALLSFAFQERFIAVNPGAGIRVDGFIKSSDRRPFTKEELRQLFAAPLFTWPWLAGGSRSKVSDSTLRWLFLLGLFTGARIEELGQILLADIKQELGTAYLSITEYAGGGEPQEAKRLKTASSVRAIPIHPQLIALGFLSFVDRARSNGEMRLFRDLELDTLGVKTKEASRRAGRLIDTAVGADPRIVFHSLRHSFKDFCRDADIPKDAHDQLTGHAPAGVGGSYGLGRAIANLDRHVHRIETPFIDWKAIETACHR